MTCVAIIPARGGSKRIPGKNIRNFLGKPVIAYSIEAALNSKLFDEVMVSTDDETIAQIAKEYGADVPFMRSVANSGDFATTVDVILEVLSQYEADGKNFTTGCCIYPTAPFVSSELLQRALQLMNNQNFDTVFPIVQFDYPIQRSLQINQDGKVSMVWPEFLLSRSQELPGRFHDTGQFYWFKSESLVKEKALFGNNSGALVLGSLECHDIDTPEDWELAELKYKRLFNK